MNNLTIIKLNGQLLVDSREVGEMVGKRHDNLVRDIKGYKDILEDSSKLSSQDFFIESTYSNAQNKLQPCYLLTKKGCDMVANKMTGEKGILFTAEYVTRFEEMENRVQVPKLSKELQAIFAIDGKQQELEVKVEVLKDDIEGMRDNMPLFNVECKELQALVRKVGIKALGGYKSPAYNDSSLRCRVYQDIQQQLKREFGVTRYEAIKRCQLEKATSIVNNYTIPFILQEVVTEENNQMKFGEVI